MKLSFHSVAKKVFYFLIYIWIYTHAPWVVFMEWWTIWNYLELPRIFLSSAYWQEFQYFFLLLLLLVTGETCDWAGCSAVSDPFLCFLVYFFCNPYQLDPISCLFPDNSCCTTTMQDQIYETHLNWIKFAANATLIHRYTFSCLIEEEIPVFNWFLIHSRWTALESGNT